MAELENPATSLFDNKMFFFSKFEPFCKGIFSQNSPDEKQAENLLDPGFLAGEYNNLFGGVMVLGKLKTTKVDR